MKRLLLISLICILVFGLVITVSAQEKVHITFFQKPYIGETEDKELGWYEKEIIAEFEAMYPEVEVELRMNPWEAGANKLEMLIAADNAPDIVLCDWRKTTDYVRRGLVYDFEEVFTEEEKAEYIPDIIQRCSDKDGKLSTIPWGIGVQGILAINTEVAKKAGAYELLPLDDPYRIWTFEEFEVFLEKCKPLTEEGIYPLALGFVETWADGIIMNLMRNWGADLLFDENNKSIINSPEAIECLAWLVHLNDEGLLYPHPESAGGSEIGEAFTKGKVMMDSASPGLLTNPFWTDKIEFVFTMLPSKKGVEPKANSYWIGMVVFDNGDPIKGKYAKLFSKYWCSKDQTIASLMWPKTEGAPIFENESLNFMASVGVKYGGDFGYSHIPYFNEFRELFLPEMQAVFTHLKTPKEALDDLAKRANKIAEEY